MVDVATLSASIDEQLRSDAPTAADVCAVTAAALPGDGAAMTLMVSDLGRETVFASDEVVAGLERVQYSVGAGPTLSVYDSGRPMLVPDVATSGTVQQWPELSTWLAESPVRALFCFPMSFGAIRVGVCTLYRRTPGAVSQQQVNLTLQAVDLTTLALLELRTPGGAGSPLTDWLSVDGQGRQQVHQATGMLMVQLKSSAETAFARLRGHAFAQDLDLEAVATEVVSRQLRLDPD